MRTQTLITAFFSLAISGCGEGQPTLEPDDVTGHNTPQVQFTLDCIPYSVIKTNQDGSLFIHYQAEVQVPRKRTFVDLDGREIVCTEIDRTFVERTSTVPPDTDISEYLRVLAGGSSIDHETDLRFDEYVDPAPAVPAPSEVDIPLELEVVTSITERQSTHRVLE